jgi:hypothetical protein
MLLLQVNDHNFLKVWKKIDKIPETEIFDFQIVIEGCGIISVCHFTSARLL